MKTSNGTATSEQNKAKNVNLRIAKMMAITLGVFLATWMSSLIINASLIGDNEYSQNTITHWLPYMVFTNAFINPIIYAWYNSDFRVAFKKVLNIKH